MSCVLTDFVSGLTAKRTRSAGTLTPLTGAPKPEVDAAAARVVDHAERVGRERGEELDEHQEALVALPLRVRLGRAHVNQR